MRPVRGAVSGDDGAGGASELAKNELLELHFGTGIVDINADETVAGVVVELHSFGDFQDLHTRLFGKVDIKRVSFGIAVQFYGLYRLSGKAFTLLSKTAVRIALHQKQRNSAVYQFSCEGRTSTSNDHAERGCCDRK